MAKKFYHTPDETPQRAEDPAVAYGKSEAATEWNPNVPFYGTQEEWWEHYVQ